MPLLHMGSHGEEVRRLQALLKHHDPHLAVDGIFGRHTERSVRAAQRRHGLYPPDGIAGPITMGALHRHVPARALHAPSVTRPLSAPPPAAHTKGDPGPLRPIVEPALGRAERQQMPASLAMPVAGMRMSLAGRRFIIRHEAQRGVSNHLHHPSMGSGVTIGPGYDMKDRTAAQVAQHLRLVGVDPSAAAVAAQGAGLSGQAARDFTRAHKSLLDLSDNQQAALLTHIIGHYELMVHRAITVDLHQYEFDAMVSYAYNPGGGWRRTTQHINARQPHEAMVELSRHVFSRG